MSNDKKNEKPEKPESTYSNEDLSTTVMTAVAAAIQATRPQGPTHEQLQAQVLGKTACGQCRQMRSSCNGDHVQMVVWPDNPYHAEFFQGVRINGVLYCSPGPHIAITVPKKNDIKSIMARKAALEESYTRTKKHGRNLGSPGNINRRVI